MYQQIIDKIKGAHSIVITSHKSPDGDSIGSSLGLFQFIQKLNKQVTICHPDKAPSFLLWMEDIEAIHTLEENPETVKQLIEKADLIFSLDYNALNRVGDEMQALLEAASADFIMIDHHLNPDDYATICLSQPEICSTSQLIFEVIAHSSEANLLDARIATPLYLGIVTDTGSFRYPSVDARTHEILAEMLKLGVVHYKVHENTFDQNSVNRLRLRGFATSEKLEILHYGKVAMISLTEEELNRFEFQKGDTEGLVNIALSIEGVKAAAFFAEKEGKIKISFRSKGDYEVNVLSNENFNGGGHKYAAGGISDLPMKETIEKFKSLIPNYFD